MAHLCNRCLGLLRQFQCFTTVYNLFPRCHGWSPQLYVVFPNASRLSSLSRVSSLPTSFLLVRASSLRARSSCATSGWAAHTDIWACTDSQTLHSERSGSSLRKAHDSSKRDPRTDIHEPGSWLGLPLLYSSCYLGRTESGTQRECAQILALARISKKQKLGNRGTLTCV